MPPTQSTTLDLLARLEIITAEQRAALLDLTRQPRADLDALEAALQDRAEQTIDDPNLDDDDLAELEAIAASVESVRAERGGRPDPQELRAQLRARLRNEALTEPARPVQHRPRRPEAMNRPPTGTRQSRTAMVAPSGRVLTDAADLAREFRERAHDLSGLTAQGKHRVASITTQWPESRRLGTDPVANGALIAAATSPQAITASGGICAPVNVRYEVDEVSTDERPVRDTSLARFSADRGGVRFLPPPTLADVSDAVGVWSAETDASPGELTKNCGTLACPEPDEVVVDAITKCLNLGNFKIRFAAELVTADLAVLAASHARLAEQTLVAAMVAGSSAVSTSPILGTTRDLLAVLDRAGASLRHRHRMQRNAPLHLLSPVWLLDQMRSDLAREAPGATAERLSTADAEIERFLSVRSINVTWWLDDALAGFDAQGVGALVGWPTMAQVCLYPEGSWLHVDGGTLDLGIIRDSVTARTNDAISFAETFESVALVGPESLAVSLSVCPDGTTAGPVDISVCDQGS